MQYLKEVMFVLGLALVWSGYHFDPSAGTESARNQ